MKPGSEIKIAMDIQICIYDGLTVNFSRFIKHTGVTDVSCVCVCVYKFVFMKDHPRDNEILRTWSECMNMNFSHHGIYLGLDFALTLSCSLIFLLTIHEKWKKSLWNVLLPHSVQPKFMGNASLT